MTDTTRRKCTSISRIRETFSFHVSMLEAELALTA
jgi:hypothetical protein